MTPDAKSRYRPPAEPPLSASRVPEEGRILPPYGGRTNCMFDGCQVPLNEEAGAYLHTDRRTGRLVVFCGGCSLEMRLHYALQFPLVAL